MSQVVPQSGALLVDKPEGLTSSAVVQKIKARFGFKRLGHAGTLDPIATGLLVVLFGKATRLQSLLLEGKKSYEGVFLLGRATDTDDISGNTISEDCELEPLRTACARDRGIERELERAFVGEILQVPPEYSAIKIAGQRSYKLARQGEKVVLSGRTVTIHAMSLEFIDAPYELAYRMTVSKGTYVRAVARDIGKYLEVPACVKSIRRVASCNFLVSEAVTLERLLEAPLIPNWFLDMERLVEHLPRITFEERDSQLLKMGNQNPLRTTPAIESAAAIASGNAEVAALFDNFNHFFGLARKVGAKDGQRWELSLIV